MRFIFQEKWMNLPLAIEFAKKMADIVPMIRLLEKSPQYKAYWGVFYSTLWTLSPIFLIFGYLSGHFAREKERNFIEGTPGWKFILAFAFIFVLVIFIYLVPDLGSRFWFNELSANPLIITFTSLEIAVAIFLLGRGFAVVQIKLKKTFNQES